MNLNFRSLKTKHLKKNDIKEICRLKSTFWNFSLKKQINWFNKNIKQNDIHNCLYIDKKLIGYTALRKGYFTFKKKKFLSKRNFLLFETLIIAKKYRDFSIGKMLMNFNNMIINKHNQPAFLICKSRLIKFYSKFNWVKISKKDFNTEYKSFNCSGMTYKLNTFKNTKVYFNIY